MRKQFPSSDTSVLKRIEPSLRAYRRCRVGQASWQTFDEGDDVENGSVTSSSTTKHLRRTPDLKSRHASEARYDAAAKAVGSDIFVFMATPRVFILQASRVQI
jgi:hypothetical protein